MLSRRRLLMNWLVAAPLLLLSEVRMQIDKTTYDKANEYPAGTGWDRRPKDTQPVTVIVHTTNGAKGSTFEHEATFLLESKNVSSHYLIGKDGHTVQFLEPKAAIAWHAGTVIDPMFANASSIGIEQHFTPGEDNSTSTMEDTVAQLCTELCDSFDIVDINMHRFAASPPGRKIDPSNFTDAEFEQWRKDLLEKAFKKSEDERLRKILLWKLEHGDVTPVPPAVETPSETSVPPSKPPYIPRRYNGFAPFMMNHLDAPEEAPVQYALRVPNRYYTEVDIRLIVHYYYTFANQVGMDYILPIAQSFHETTIWNSYWSQRPRRNPAGIGVTGQAGKGHSYASWEIAVQNHIGLLLQYIYKDEEMNAAQLAMANFCSHRAPARVRGTSKQIVGLNGRWAVPGRTYGQRIALVANRILQLA